MLTVLIRHKETKRDVIYCAESVEFEASVFPDREGVGLLINHGGERSTHLGLSQTEHDHRDVFVMNENGQTVARYAL